MSRTKNLTVVVRYARTNLIINDLGEYKSPRYELYDTVKKQSIKKSDDPLVFDDYVIKIWNSQKDN